VLFSIGSIFGDQIRMAFVSSRPTLFHFAGSKLPNHGEFGTLNISAETGTWSEIDSEARCEPYFARQRGGARRGDHRATIRSTLSTFLMRRQKIIRANCKVPMASGRMTAA
jgi:hypothetical protein